jgi:hypothetical protein
MMEAFPFSRPEWQTVQNITGSIVNASAMNDNVLMDSSFAELVIILEELRERHGNHPILLETTADFCGDPLLQLDLYRSAIHLAEDNNLPTCTIRISLAEVLLEKFNDRDQAARELSACESEVISNADDSEQQTWAELMKQCTE